MRKLIYLYVSSLLTSNTSRETSFVPFVTCSCWSRCYHQFSPVCFDFNYQLRKSVSHLYFICRTPIELIKCKMQVQMLVVLPVGAAEALVGSGVPQKLPGPISLLVSVIHNAGLWGLWLGHTGTFTCETGGMAAWLGTKRISCLATFSLLLSL